MSPQKGLNQKESPAVKELPGVPQSRGPLKKESNKKYFPSCKEIPGDLGVARGHSQSPSPLRSLRTHQKELLEVPQVP